MGGNGLIWGADPRVRIASRLRKWQLVRDTRVLYPLALREHGRPGRHSPDEQCRGLTRAPAQ